MTLQYIYGIIADIAFYLTCSSPAVLLIILLVGARASVYLPAVIIIISASASCSLRERGVFRFLPLILLPLAVLLAENVLVAIWVFPAIVYAVVCAIKNSYTGLFSDFNDFFKITAFIVPVIGILVNIQPVANGWDMGTSVLSIMFLCAGISKLRYMRQTKNVLKNSRAFHINNLIVMLIVIAGTLAITGALAYGADQIGDIELNFSEQRHEEITSPPKMPHDDPVVDPNAVEAKDEQLTDASNDVKNMTFVQVVLLAAIVGAVSFIAVRMIKKRPENKLRDENTVVTDAASPNAPRDKINMRRRTNRDSIRRIYKRFLKHLSAHDIKIETYHTSEDINSLAKRTAKIKEPYDELQELYASARYDDDAGITREHVLRMKELYLAVKRST